MKKVAAISIILFLVFCAFISCRKETGAPKAGTAKVEDMLRLVPNDAKGVLFVDFHKAMTTEYVNKVLQKDESFSKYQEFIEKTGIDPQKDIFFINVALLGSIRWEKTKDQLEATAKEGAVIINLKYDKDTLLSLIKEKAAEKKQELSEEDYNGLTLYSLEIEKEDLIITFIDDSNILFGSKDAVMFVIDVLQKKRDNIFKNKPLFTLLEKTNKDAIFWWAMLFTPKTIDMLTKGNPMLSDLESINAASLYFDYKNKNIIAEIKVMGTDETKNKKIAELLSGFKALGSMAASEKPEIGELMNRIEITSRPDYVKIYASIPEDLLNKLIEEKPKK